MKNIDKFQAKLHDMYGNDPSIATISTNGSRIGEEALSQFDYYYSKQQDAYRECFLETVDLNGSTPNFFNKLWITVPLAKSCITKNKVCVHSLRDKSGYKDAKNRTIYIYRAKLRNLIRLFKDNHYK